MGPVFKQQKEKKTSEGELVQVSFLFLPFPKLNLRGKKKYFARKGTRKRKIASLFAII
jgi:hypothetical protein